MSDYRHWTSDEEKYIQDHWRLQTDGEMAAALDRSEGAVRTKRRELRCSPQKTWTPEDLDAGRTAVPGRSLGYRVDSWNRQEARAHGKRHKSPGGPNGAGWDAEFR